MRCPGGLDSLGSRDVQLKRIARKAWRSLSGDRRRTVHYVNSDGRWSFHWDEYYITRGLRDGCGLRVETTNEPWGLDDQIIHFADRYAFLHGPFRELRKSNAVVLTWFHGDPSDNNPAMRDLIDRLIEAKDCVDRFVVTCSISQKALRQFGIPESKIVSVPLGVALDEFVPPSGGERQAIRAKLGIPPDAFCVGSFQKDGTGWGDGVEPKTVKGPDLFLEAVRHLARSRKNTMVLLTGPARGYVKQGLDRVGIPYVHRFLEDYRDIVRYYQALDLYLVASRSEGGPKALVEAWATGVPIVTTRVGMCADLVRDRRNGMLVDVGDASGLAEAALRMAADDELRERCIGEGLRCVRSLDWWEIATLYYQRVYRDLLRR